MQAGLAIEEHVVAVDQVALDLVAKLEVAVRVLAQEAQIQALAILADDIFGARLACRRMRTVLYQLLQPAHTYAHLLTCLS